MNLDFYVKYCSLASSDYCATTDSGRSSATVSPMLSSSDVSSAATPNFAAVGSSIHQSPIAAMLINAASINNKQPGPISPTTSCDSGNGGGSGTTNPKYKTEMCRSVFAKIPCKYGDNCQFAHTEDEMRNRPRNNKYKTINCKNFHLKGYCYYGPKCDFSVEQRLVTKLCDLSALDNDSVTSVSWCEKGDTLAVGTQRGLCQIYDVATQKRLLTLEGHTSRVGCLAWNGDLICTGSRDRLILQRDIRSPPLFTEKRLTAHRQEVCGLKWSPDHQYLASGGNDNQLLVWSLRSQKPVQAYCQHVAAVKAIAWSPHHHGLLVSGGGTADRCMNSPALSLVLIATRTSHSNMLLLDSIYPGNDELVLDFLRHPRLDRRKNQQDFFSTTKPTMQSQKQIHNRPFKPGMGQD
uniref:C3H1-type domain-containing protein n=1 Tax=Romanomermis culicivorax TaxID=13658 RepID=A0A915JSC9_ROMCU